MAEAQQAPGWWLALDGKWYPPAGSLSTAAPTDTALLGTTTEWPPPTPAVHRPPIDFGANFAMGPEGPLGHRRGGGHRLRWAAVVVAVALVAAGVYVARSRVTPTWNPRVLSIVHFVEQHRGLTFKEPVRVEFLDDAQFDQKVSVPQPTQSSDRVALANAVGELRALGLVHGNVNLASADNKLSQADVVGEYVDSDKTVYVRGTALTPYVRVTLAHELTHALQDQYFDLTSLESNAHNGDDAALTALVEGDAVRIQDDYQQSLSPADQQAYQQEQDQIDKASGSAGDVPEILSDMLSFPYAFGPTFVDALLSDGGNPAVDGAFQLPPVAEAQIVDPVDYPLGWKPVPVPVPALGSAHPIDTPSSFGQVSLFEVLGSRLGFDTAWSAVQGWRGDNSVPYRQDGRTCVAIDVAMADAGSSAGLAAAGRQWAQSVPGAKVTQNGTTVDLRSCDPGPSAPSPPAITPSAFDVLAARAAMTDLIMNESKVDVTLAQCISDGVVTRAGPAGYGLLTADNLSAAQNAEIAQWAASSAAACRAQGLS